VFEALQAPDLFISGKGVMVGIPEGDDGFYEKLPLLITTDRPRHTQLRALVNRAFTPRRVARLEPRIRDIARSLLDGVEGRREFDLVREFSGPLPTIVIAELLGVPVEDQGWFKEMSNGVAEFDPTALRDGDAPDIGPAVELAGYLAEVLTRRRRDSRDDLLSALLAAEIDGQRLSEPELIAFAFLLLVGGERDHHEPDQQCRDPARSPSRPATPAPGGPDAHPDGGRGVPSLRLGAHFCLGANLARLEARVAFEELLARLPDYRTTGSRVERICSGPVRGALSLPVCVA